MNAELVESVRAFLRCADNKVTAKVIADEIEASPIDVGKALDELKGLHHADCDGLHRWHLTEKGRLAAGPEDGPATPSTMPAPGTISARLLETIGTDGHTVPELVTITGLTKVQVTSNLSSLRGRGLAHTRGERKGDPIWRLGGVRTLKPIRNKTCTQCGSECAPTSGALCRKCYLANAEAKRKDPPDRAALAAQHDKEEAQAEAENCLAKVRALSTVSIERVREAVDEQTDVSGVQDLIADVCDEIKAILLDKNRKYGNSALSPLRVFSKADPIEQINVRLDDKLSRVLSAQADDLEDAELDLVGYLVLKRVAKRMQST